ncbi:MAG TPA: alkaline phosphatase family protein [Anaerolineaceae bacterium]
MPNSRQAVVFLIDGLRPDAIEQTATPAIHRLALSGVLAQACTVSPELTLPCITSLMHSQPPQTHGVLDNLWTPNRELSPGLFDLIKDQGGSAAAVYSYEPLRDLARPEALDFSYYHRHTHPHTDGRELELAAVAADALVRDQPTLVFLYIEIADLAGHGYGWMSPEYLEGVARADRAVELVLDEIAAANQMEETIFLLTADHGGHDRQHGWHGGVNTDNCSHPEDQAIPWILAGAGVRKGVTLAEELSILDCAPTLAHLLGLPIPAAWQGRVITGALEA